VSPGTRLPAYESYAMNRPSAEIAGWRLSSLPGAPSNPPLTRLVHPINRSWTNTSRNTLVSPGTRFVESDTNATYRPSAEMDGAQLAPFPSTPLRSTLTRVVTPATRSRTNTSSTPLVSPPTRFRAEDLKATYRPSADTDGSPLAPAPGLPSTATLINVVAATVAASAVPPGTSAAMVAAHRASPTAPRPVL
jgi:hypothetical protein